MQIPVVSVCIPITQVPVSQVAVPLRSSVQAVLEQSFQDFEIVISLDNREDLPNELEGYLEADARIRIVSNFASNTRAGALNTTIVHSRGEFIKFVLPSDILHPKCLEKFVQAFRTCRSLSLASCAFEWKTPEHNCIGIWRNEYTSEVTRGADVARRQLKEVSDLVGSISATFFKRDLGLSCIDTKYFNLGEFAFWARLAAQGDYLFIDNPLCTVTSASKDYADYNLNQESGLGFHDFLRLRTDFAAFMRKETVDPAAFVEKTRAAMEREFRQTVFPRQIIDRDIQNVARILHARTKNPTEQIYILECYARLCHDLLTAYGDCRGTIFQYREQLASIEKSQNGREKKSESKLNPELTYPTSPSEFNKLAKDYADISSEYQRVTSSLSWRLTEPQTIKVWGKKLRKDNYGN